MTPGRAQLEALLASKAPKLKELLLEHEKRALEAWDYTSEDAWAGATLADLEDIGLSKSMAQSLLGVLRPGYTGISPHLPSGTSVLLSSHSEGCCGGVSSWLLEYSHQIHGGQQTCRDHVLAMQHTVAHRT
jgi:hypothetical protein